MFKISKALMEVLKECTLDDGKCEKEHRRGSSFYITSELTITQELIDSIKEDENLVVPDWLLDKIITITGTWDDDWGTEIGDISFYSYIQKMNPKYVALMTAAQDSKILQDFIYKHCPEYVMSYEKIEVEVGE